jgi:NAD/NADP transhydrogenase alpha subunit
VFSGTNDALLKAMAAKKGTAIAMDLIPRTLTRAQGFDALSSQAGVAGAFLTLEQHHSQHSLINESCLRGIYGLFYIS